MVENYNKGNLHFIKVNSNNYVTVPFLIYNYNEMSNLCILFSYSLDGYWSIST